MNSNREKIVPPPPRLLISESVTLPELVEHMKRGRTILGSAVKPYPWLDYTMKPKTDMEKRVENFMTSCTFKTTASCVLG